MRIISDDGKLMTFRFKNYATDKKEDWRLKAGMSKSFDLSFDETHRGTVRSSHGFEVAAILVAIDRSGQSLLIQIQQELAGPGFKGRWIFSPYQIQLIESMLSECVEAPRPLMRSVLGKYHPLIREAEKNAARPPPEPVDGAVNA